MNSIELMLSGKMPMNEFIEIMKNDKEIQEIIRGFIPEDAKFNPNHSFWRKIGYEAVLQRDFDYYRFLTELVQFDGSLGENLNVFSIIKRGYSFKNPDFLYTDEYKELYNLYLCSVNEYYEGPEVMALLEQIVRDSLVYKTKANRVKSIKEELKKRFHINDNKHPYWIQGGEWPMGVNSPMKYIGKKKIEEGFEYIFQDVDDESVRVVTQYY